jgi:hypothetical protein
MPAPSEWKTTFAELSETEFEGYARDLSSGYPRAPEVQRVQAYLQQTVAQDKAEHAAAQAELNTKRQRRRQHQAVIEKLAVEHSHDFSRAQGLAEETPSLSDDQIIALLSNDNVEVYLHDKALSPTAAVTISGDNVTLKGLGSTGTAAAGTLVNEVSVDKNIVIEGSNATVEGIHFKSSADNCISFANSPTDLTLKNCTFEGTGTYADAMGLNGLGNGGGKMTIEGCRFVNFGSWLLIDATMGGAQPTTGRLSKFVLQKCRFDNCAGSIAVRGRAADPNGPVRFTDNVFAAGAGGVHALFWDQLEANNMVSVVCKGNVSTGRPATGYEHTGFLQAWSRSSVPWFVDFNNNEMLNYNSVVRIACSATFYSPNTADEEHQLKAKADQSTGATYGASFVYGPNGFEDATATYAPENIATFPTEPATDFTGLPNFTHA